jgi:septation ring formation regulator EzrA
MVDIRELDQIRSELNVLHQRSTSNRTEISSHEAVCEERYKHISQSLDNMSRNMTELHAAIANLQELATQGKTSITTLLWIGGAVAGITAYFLMISDLFTK